MAFTGTGTNFITINVFKMKGNKLMTVETKRFIIVGVGGIGSYLADFIGRVINVNAPGSQLVLVDGDQFEPKNAARQNFSKYGNKARSVGGDLMDKLDNVFVIPKAAWVVSEAKANSDGEDEEGVSLISAETLLKEGDVVFCCVDNFGARKLIFDAAAKLDNIDVFTGGNEDDGFGSTYYYRRREGVDVTDHPGIHHNEFVNPPDKNTGELSCAERSKLVSGTQLIATNVAVAANMCHDAHQALFADAASDIDGDQSHVAAAILTSEKMWNLDDATSRAWARCSDEVFELMCEINSDIAEITHGKVVKLETVS